MSKSTTHNLVLENLLGSKLRVKVLKFLFRNYPANIGTRELARRVQEPQDMIKKEMKMLEKIGLIRGVK